MAQDTFKGAALTEEEQDAFESLREVFYSTAILRAEDSRRPAVMRGFLDGQEVALVVVVERDDEGEYTIEPVAILLNEALRSRIGNANDERLPQS